jgi:hypothetical protein
MGLESSSTTGIKSAHECVFVFDFDFDFAFEDVTTPCSSGSAGGGGFTLCRVCLHAEHLSTEGSVGSNEDGADDAIVDEQKGTNRMR